MNKKFSTLMTTGLLLSGALFCNVNAETVTFATDSIKDTKVLSCAAGDTILINSAVDLSTGDGAKKYFIITQPNVTVLGKGNAAKLTGRIIVVSEGVTIKNLPIETTPVAEDDNGYWTKTALTAFANALTVDSCTFTAGTPAKGTIPNGIVIYPQGNAVDYNLEGNTFTNLNTTVGEPQTWYSSAIQVYKKTTVETKENDPVKALIDAKENALTAPAGYGKASASPVINAADIVAANTFSGCAADLVVRFGNELDTEGYYVEYAHITKAPVTKAALAADIVAALVDAVNNYKEGASVIDVKDATPEEVAAIITNSSNITANMAKELADKNILINTTTTAADGKEVKGGLVLGEVKNAPEGAITLVIDKNGTVAAYASDPVKAAVASGNYLLMTSDGKVLSAKTDGKAEKKDLDAKNPELVSWDLMYDAATKKFRFYNAKAKVYLKDNTGALVSVDADADKKIGPTVNLGKILDASNDLTITLGNCYVPSEGLKAGDLRSTFGSSFSVGIERTTSKKEEKQLANNPFDNTSLKPVQWLTHYRYNPVTKEYDIPVNSYNDSYELEPAKADTTAFMLQKDNGKLIVMQIENMYSSTNPTGKDTYRIVEIDPKDLATSLKKGEYKYASIFTLNAAYDFKTGVNKYLKNILVTGDMTSDNTVYELGSVKLSNKNTLTAVVKGETIDAITVELSTYRRLSVKDMMTGKFYTITNKNTNKKYSTNYGKVLGLNYTQNNIGAAAFMDPSDVLVGYPETQWAATDASYKNEDNVEVVRIKLTNRENPEGEPYYIYPANCYKTDDADVYAYWVDPYSPFAQDTIEIKAIDTKASDGFVRFEDYTKLKDQAFYLGSYSAVRDTAYVTENHKENHQVGLVADKADANEWRIVPLMFQKEDAWGNPKGGELVPDTICVVSELGLSDGTTKKDSLKMLAFSFKNIDNNEFLAYDYARNRFTTGSEDNKIGYTTYGHQFVLKIMGGDSTKYNLVLSPVEMKRNSEEGIYYTNSDNKPYSVVDLTEKAYAGETSAKGILNKYDMYQQNESDLFTLTQKESAQYLSFNQGDIIKIFRAEYAESESNVLYEKGEFLGVGNAIENNKINPAIYVDPIDGSKDHPEYLLAVNAIHKDTTYTCNEPSHANLIHKEDTTWGRFLVNLADSAIVTDGKDDIHVNKYTYIDGSTPFAKLGFVQGVCSNDTLFHVDTVAVGVESEYKITEAPQLFKFAFRVVEPAQNINESTFVLETGYKYPSDLDNDVTVGYVRYINGHIVVTPNIRQAEVFKLKEDTRNPVANEGIATSEVSVIAGNGFVTIKGAAGKNVAISNILGQTIANTVVTSDEATIAAPAGVVVVAIEGEAAVKAIVK